MSLFGVLKRVEDGRRSRIKSWSVLRPGLQRIPDGLRRLVLPGSDVFEEL